MKVDRLHEERELFVISTLEKDEPQDLGLAFLLGLAIALAGAFLVAIAIGLKVWWKFT